jgi:hypothetical protein
VPVLATEEDLHGLEASGLTRRKSLVPPGVFMDVRPCSDPDEGSY